MQGPLGWSWEVLMSKDLKFKISCPMCGKETAALVPESTVAFTSYSIWGGDGTYFSIFCLECGFEQKWEA